MSRRYEVRHEGILSLMTSLTDCHHYDAHATRCCAMASLLRAHVTLLPDVVADTAAVLSLLFWYVHAAYAVTLFYALPLRPLR